MASRPAAPLDAATVTEWHADADVVVVGYGVAGATAAVEAATRGASVHVLEQTGGWGGAAAMSGGFIYMGGGTPLQKACGFEDSPDDMYRFLEAAIGPGVPEAKTRLFCDESVDHYRWLSDDVGVRFKPVFHGEPAWVVPNDEGLMYTGGENAWPFNEIARPAPRGHVPEMLGKKVAVGERGGGYMLMLPLAQRAESLGVAATFDVRVDRLVVERDGRVCGVVGRRYGEELAVRARRGVVLASGGFVYNDDMLARFNPLIRGRPGSATEEHDGQAMRMAMALGADLGRMDGAEVAVHIDPQLLVRGIVVNAVGQRFVNEDTYPGRVAHVMVYKQDNTAYFITDDANYESAPESMEGMRRRPDWVAGTVAELEADIGLPTGSLQHTVEYYNRHAAEGRDPMFHKDRRWLTPLEAPFGAIELSGQISGFALGGLLTTVDGEVQHVDGDPIPGLFAAGRVTWGVPAWGYASGLSLGDGSFFGRRAGRAAAAAHA